MKCREAQYWLYSFQPNADWPADVVGHLQGCADCQMLQAQLRQIDQTINKVTTPPASDAKDKLLERLGETPQTRATPKSLTPLVAQEAAPSWFWFRLGVMVTGMAAMLTLGFFAGRTLAPPVVVPGEPVEIVKTIEVIREKPIEVIREKIVTVSTTPSDREFVGALLKRNALLAQTSDAKERLETLLDMADDCRQHAVTLIQKGPRDALPLTIDLYTQLLREGVLGHLAKAPAKERPDLEGLARVRLDEMAEPMGKASNLPKVLEDQRKALYLVAMDVSASVGKPDLPKVRKWQRGESGPPALTLVRYAITICNESDAVARADSGADCIQRLMPYMVLYLAEDAAGENGDMGQQFGDMIRFGVVQSLEAAKTSDQKQAARIAGNVDRAIAEMEKQAVVAPPATRKNFEQTLDAIKKGSDRNKGKGKGASQGKGKGAQNNR